MTPERSIPAAADQLLHDVRRAPAASVTLILDANGHPARLGHGGARGSCVYLVKVNGTRRALKMCGIGHGELAFCVALQQLMCADTMDDSMTPMASLGSPTTTVAAAGDKDDFGSSFPAGLSSIALPLYVVDRRAFATDEELGAVAPSHMRKTIADAANPDDVLVGLVMPLYDCSLQRLLTAPSVDVACRARETPVTPGLPAATWAMRHPESIDSMYGMDEASTSSDDGADGPPLPFHVAPRQRAVHSLVVIAAILERVVAGLAAVRDELPHGIVSGSSGSDAPSCQMASPGFAHQDIRADNVLLSRSGRVVICDFELVAHVSATDRTKLVQPSTASTYALAADTTKGCLTSASGGGGGGGNASGTSGRRMVSEAFHAPEGPNCPGGDAWLIGLLGLELFTGVTPIIKRAIAFDDFGAGPLLTVDPDNGIGWDQLRRHVHTRVRPFPSSDAASSDVAVGYMDPPIAEYSAQTGKDAFAVLHAFSTAFEDFLAACLANDPRDRASLGELRKHRLFAMLNTVTRGQPQSAIRAWVNVVGTSASSSPTKVS